MDNCQKVKAFYDKILSVRKEMAALFSSGLRETDRKEFIRQGEELKAKFEKVLADAEPLIDAIDRWVNEFNVLSGKFTRIAENLGMTRENRLNLGVNTEGFIIVGGYVNRLDIPLLTKVVTHPDAPIKKLSLRKLDIEDPEMKQIIVALQRAKKGITDLDLSQTKSGYETLKALEELILMPGNTIRYVDLRGTFVWQRLREEFNAAVKKSGRSVIVKY